MSEHVGQTREIRVVQPDGTIKVVLATCRMIARPKG
jgi:hypothetical protein